MIPYGEMLQMIAERTGYSESLLHKYFREMEEYSLFRFTREQYAEDVLHRMLQETSLPRLEGVPKEG